MSSVLTTPTQLDSEPGPLEMVSVSCAVWCKRTDVPTRKAITGGGEMADPLIVSVGCCTKMIEVGVPVVVV